MRSPTVVAVLLCLVACQPPAPNASTNDDVPEAFWPTPTPGAKPKVLLVGWDGIRPDVLAEVSTPVFDALAAEGTFSARAETARPTVSGPCWSSILTGVWPEKHGVLSNDFTPNRYDTYPDVFTLIESVRPELETFAVADWLPLVSDDAGGPLIGEAIDKTVVLDGYELGWLDADSVSAEMAIGEIANGDPDILFVYAGSPDEISHTIGGLGPEYRASIETADRHLGRMVDAIRSRPGFSREDWLVLVVTDHGRTETGGHGGETPEETTIFYLASGPSAAVGTPETSPTAVDLVATALAHLGIQPDPAWSLDGQPVGLKQ
jgi:predicted AlkP superfamily pyrophosphatase or phosphodiesterase